jgi:hypothetical protein
MSNTTKLLSFCFKYFLDFLLQVAKGQVPDTKTGPKDQRHFNASDEIRGERPA